MYSLSIVFPIFNEEIRLKKTLPILIKFLKKNKKKNIEIIFVNDGSFDSTHLIIKNFINLYSKSYNLKLIGYKKNMGKGYAIKTGILKARNDWTLICDIDFSVHPNQLLIWKKNGLITQNNVAYFGSREHKNSRIKTSKLRVALGYFFKKFIKLLFGIKLSDTQCGFKIFNKSYSKKIFKKISSYRYTFDVEITLLLEKNGIEIQELPLKWSHKDGSKISLFKDIPIMIFDLIMIKIKN